jgi:hypothetical protein
VGSGIGAGPGPAGSPPGGAPPLDGIAERLLQVIDEGRRVASYKLALLMALMDALAEGCDPTGAAPATLHTRTIARHVVRIYLPQVREYLGGDGRRRRLSQITGSRNATALTAILRLHLQTGGAGIRPDELASALPHEFERCLDEVERTFARYPILRLQVLGRAAQPFLYDVDWTESVTLAALHRPGGGLLRFRPGAADALLRLTPLLRPLVELHWTRMVAALNGIDLEEEHLRDHLFGAVRRGFPDELRAGLVELQGGTCFYCTAPLHRRVEIDHFIPWSRWPNDAVENLVAADRCNSAKHTHLAAAVHVGRWVQRLGESSGDLARLARRARWTSEPVRTLALARTAYAHLPAGTPLWVAPDRFRVEPLEAVRRILAVPAA